MQITGLTTGKLIDYGLKAACDTIPECVILNMGGCMGQKKFCLPAACDTIYRNLCDFDRTLEALLSPKKLLMKAIPFLAVNFEK